MKSDIVINDHGLGQQIMSLVGATLYHPESDACIARHKNGKLIGGAVYTSFTRSSIEMHCASTQKKWLTRDLLWVCFDWPFKQLGCKKVFVKVREDNDTSISFVESLGFKVEATLLDVYPECRLLIYSMYSKDCRWLDMKPRFLGDRHGQ